MLKYSQVIMGFLDPSSMFVCCAMKTTTTGVYRIQSILHSIQIYGTDSNYCFQKPILYYTTYTCYSGACYFKA